MIKEFKGGGSLSTEKEAQEHGELLQSMLSTEWNVLVWQNMGWHYNCVLNYLHVNVHYYPNWPQGGGVRYHCSVCERGSGWTPGWNGESVVSAKAAVAEALKNVRNALDDPRTVFEISLFDAAITLMV